MWYGSVVNRICERSRMPKPEVGMGVTKIMWSDRYPYEIVEVIDDRHIKVREMDWVRTDSNGLSEMQEYDYFQNEDNPVITLFKTKKGQWRERIGKRGLGQTCYAIGFMEMYRDPTF